MQQPRLIIELNPIVQQTDSRSENAWHVVFTFIIPLLVGILQVHCHVSPFVTHPVNMWTFLFTVIIYCFALANYIKSRYYHTAYSKPSAMLALITGSLASISVISIFVPHKLELPLFIVWIPLPIYVARNLIMHSSQCLYQGFKNVISSAYSNTLTRFMGSRTTMDQQPRSQV
ncbi:hypothetical protein O6P43_017579 [Quillaja saponaria]|uniref:Transmembrane protein n=1 Tax=Quillaja saponaria TaxID=32244 RepID=A0AAD7PP25_QUISA|nr:hypothetical protein O6P43_017579 [Quillaja saponaria]